MANGERSEDDQKTNTSCDARKKTMDKLISIMIFSQVWALLAVRNHFAIVRTVDHHAPIRI